eukprot:gene45060-43732_t
MPSAIVAGASPPAPRPLSASVFAGARPRIAALRGELRGDAPGAAPPRAAAP